MVPNPLVFYMEACKQVLSSHSFGKNKHHTSVQTCKNTNIDVPSGQLLTKWLKSQHIQNPWKCSF